MVSQKKTVIANIKWDGLGDSVYKLVLVIYLEYLNIVHSFIQLQKCLHLQPTITNLSIFLVNVSNYKIQNHLLKTNVTPSFVK